MTAAVPDDGSVYASLDDLLAATEGGPVGEDVTLPSGRKIRVKGLSRFEWFLAGKTSDGDGNAFESIMIRMGMVRPEMTADQADAWRKMPGQVRDIAVAVDRIKHLSGVDEGAAKSDVARDGDDGA